MTELPGGLTNHNYRVRTTTQDVVVRISPPSTELLAVDREHEWRNSLAAASVGVGAPVVDYVPNRGVLVVAYLPGRTYTSADVADNLPRLATALRRLHAGPSFASRFDMFEVQRRYAAIVAGQGLPLPEGYAALEPEARRLETALRGSPERLVPCHNDLLAANIIDDGGDLRLIDYEYSGMNEPAFELGNLVNESQLDRDHLMELVEAYYGRVDDRLLARAELWGLAGRWAWTLWGVIQHHVSEVDHDFEAFTSERLELTLAGFADHRFDALLEAATSGQGR
ncbi:MAG: phosphotransferase [Pedococcus sp.]